ncbi:hypothetical protein [Streptomyces iranensis]|uniref:hypothetical protein n=1 Tax=Streptomyces iranensis TaxID=576784 RepID=UPI0039B777FB
MAAETVAMLRLDAGRHPDDPLLSELITENPRVNRGFSADVSSTTASTRETFLTDQGTHAGRVAVIIIAARGIDQAIALGPAGRGATPVGRRHRRPPRTCSAITKAGGSRPRLRCLHVGDGRAVEPASR